MELEITGTSYYNSPVWWQNFIIYVSEKYNGYDELPENLQDKYLILETKKFSGDLMFDDLGGDRGTDVRSIVFNDEKYATFFIMKWS